MKQQKLEIISNKLIQDNIYSLILGGECTPLRPGQFVDIAIPGFSLRRPISIADQECDRIELIYKVVGQGTDALKQIKKGYLDCIIPAGNGFDLSSYKEKILIIGGGMGTAPLLYLTKKALEAGLETTVIFGFRSPDQELFRDRMEKLNVSYHVSFDSEGENVISLRQKEDLENIPFAACGPLPMMAALCRRNETIKEFDSGSRPTYGQISLEARMGCGFGACVGCSIETISGMKRVCKEGPVFEADQIIWEKL